MAFNLIPAGYERADTSRSPGPVREVDAAGAAGASSHREMAGVSEIDVTKPRNSSEVKEDFPDADDNAEADRAEVERAFPLTGDGMSTICRMIGRAIGEAPAARQIRFMGAP